MEIQKQKRVIDNYYFPEEIIDKILLKLPVKDLIRCSAVCKLWNFLVKTPTFIQTHLNNQTTAGDVSGLLLLISSESNALHWDNPASLFGQYSKLLHPIDNNKNSCWTKNRGSKVVGTCNGLVCLAVSSSYIDPCPPVILWNPSIRKFGFLPSPSRAVKCFLNESYSLCYDSRIGDYKVVRIFMEPDPEVEVEVWSLARGTWKSLSNVPPDFYPDTSRKVFVNGAFHWVNYPRRRTELEEMEDFTASVVALDMVDESFRNVEIPQAFWGNRPRPLMISRYYGDGDQFWLALFDPQGDSCFDLWVMKEYGVAESWTKLFNVRLLGSLEEKPYCIEPLGLTKSGQVVVRYDRNGEFISYKFYDPEDKQFRDFGNQGDHYYYMDSFVESLVLLGQTNVFSY
ncbi:PREDICTED: F-box protein CPR30-like [Fragaria vesca subsp. vesca]|uniref:F-box protein CPR30-like n=1 Tax=Fragaria vesca subsp. vesca TaxID=101020 RepID=UPI0002C33C68|nr:PREDICTED: F-box protein CPR30-like [Fragaria vesca subsp. vesca]